MLGFVNLASLTEANTYGALLWDAVHIVAVLVVFWIVDRTAGRARFLIGYGYLVAAPILLLIWRASHAIAAPDALSWWETWWPVFYLAVAFLVLEIAVLVGARDASRHGLPAIKDAIFFVLYGILLLVALPAASG